MGHSFDMLTFDFLLKPPQPVTGLFLCLSTCVHTCMGHPQAHIHPAIDMLHITGNFGHSFDI